MNIISGIIILPIIYLFIVTIIFWINSSKAPFIIGITSFLMLIGLIFLPSVFGTIV